MVIKPNLDLTAKLIQDLDAFRKSGHREGIHASDLSQPRRTYWAAVHPLPATDAEVGYWLTGRGHHFYTVYALTGHPDTDTGGKFSEKYGIWYSPDLDELQGEFKTNRLTFEPSTQEECERFFSSYIEQCQIYAACEGINTWHLYVLFMCLVDPATREKVAPIPRVYDLEWTKAEMKERGKWIIEQRELIEDAIKRKDPSKLPLCKEAFCMKFRGQGRGKPRIPMASCKWFSLCKPEGRYEQVENPPTKIVRRRAA